MVRAGHRPCQSAVWFVRVIVLSAALSPGCGIVPKSRLDECQRLSQSLRSENARLKDQVLALQGQNRDYAERAVDDLRRLSAGEQAVEQLEQSVQAYQEDRDRLGQAYAQLVDNLGQPVRPAPGPLDRVSPAPAPGVATDRRPKGVAAPDDEERRR